MIFPILALIILIGLRPNFADLPPTFIKDLVDLETSNQVVNCLVIIGDLDDDEDESSEVLERFSLDDIALNKLNESQRLLFQLDLNNIILCHKSVAAIFDQQFYPIEPLSLKWL